MKNVLATLRTLHDDQSGQDLIEYALAASLIALAAVTTMASLGTAINSSIHQDYLSPKRLTAARIPCIPRLAPSESQPGARAKTIFGGSG